MGVRLYFIWGLATSPLEWQPITPMQLCGLITGSTSNLGLYKFPRHHKHRLVLQQRGEILSLIRNHRFWYLEKRVMSSGYDSHADSPSNSGGLGSPRERWHREQSHRFGGHFSLFGTARKWNPQRQSVTSRHPPSLIAGNQHEVMGWVSFKRKHYIRIFKGLWL